MRLILEEIPEGCSVIEHKVVLQLPDIDCSELPEKAFCKAKLHRTGVVIVISISFNFKVLQDCSRCLESFENVISGSFVLSLEPTTNNMSEASVDTIFYNREDDVIDIFQKICEECLLALPLMPLCRQDCKGIEYGTNVASADPRWGKLFELRNKMN